MDKMLPWKVVWSALGVIVAVSSGLLAALAELDPLLVTAAFLLAGLVCLAMGRKAIDTADVFDGVKTEARDQIKTAVTIAVFANTGLAVFSLVSPDMAALWVAVGVALFAIECGVAKWMSYLIDHDHQNTSTDLTEQKPQQVVQVHENMEDRNIRVARGVFEAAGLEWLQIWSYEPVTRDGRPIGVRFEVQIPPKRAAKAAQDTGKDKQSKAKLTAEDAEPLAIAFGYALNVDIHSDWVTIEKLSAAGRYSVTAVFENVLGAVIPYVDDPRPAKISDPFDIGYKIDGTAVPARLDKAHWLDIGQTRSGKSSLIHRKIAQVTKCPDDAVMIVAGTEKVYDSYSYWVEPFLNTGQPLPVRVVHGPQDMANMLVALLNLGRARQVAERPDRGQFKTIIVQIDEAAFALRDNTTKAKYQGKKYTLSQLVEMAVKGITSAKIFIHLATQRGTVDNLGDEGGNILGNIGTTTMFMTSDQGEVWRLMGDSKLPMPTNPGQFWIRQSAADIPLAQVKGSYIQEPDPQRDKLHDGETVEDVARARIGYRYDVDEWSQRVAGFGEWWASLHHYATDEFINYVRGVDGDSFYNDGPSNTPAAASAATSGDAAAVDLDEDEDLRDLPTDERIKVESERIDAEFAEMLAKATANEQSAQAATPAPTPAPAPAPAPEPEPAVDVPPTRKGRILAALERAPRGDGMTKAQLLAALHSMGDEVPDGTLGVVLSQMKKDGAIAQYGGSGSAYYLTPDLATQR